MDKKDMYDALRANDASRKAEAEAELKVRTRRAVIVCSVMALLVGIPAVLYMLWLSFFYHGG